MKYRKKPIVIEAFKWTGGPDQTEDPEWIIDAMESTTVTIMTHPVYGCTMMIKTLEGDMLARPGDYVIKGINNEIYPCKPDVFEKTYEAVE